MYRPGEKVECFFRTSGTPDRSFPTRGSHTPGLVRPRVGVTDGWVTACVLSAWPPPNGGKDAPVHVCFTHPFWSNRRGEVLEPDEQAGAAAAAEAAVAASPRAADMARELGVDALFAPVDVRSLDDARGYVPMLSAVVVRWAGEPTRFNEAQWGAISASVSDTFIEHFTDSALYASLGPRYEVVSVFIQRADDLHRLQPAALAGSLRGRHRCALYFLWPTLFQDGAPQQQMAMVHAGGVFGAMRAFEAAGVPTRFPHPSQLYATLLSKEWQAAACLTPQLRVPPTTALNRALVAADPARAARTALAALAHVRAAAQEDAPMGGGGGGGATNGGSGREAAAAPRLGVAKLGHAWEAVQVRVWSGEHELAGALSSLCGQPGCEAPLVLVQDFVPHDCELRAYVVRGEVRHVVYTDFDVDNWHASQERGFTKSPDSFSMLGRAAAVAQWFDGDEAAMAHAEGLVTALVQRWGAWLRAVAAEPVPAIRIDFLARRVASGRAEVSTLELTEAGFSLLGWEGGPAAVAGALLDSCFDDLGPSEAEASLLRAFHARPPPLRRPAPPPPQPGSATSAAGEARTSGAPSAEETAYIAAAEELASAWGDAHPDCDAEQPPASAAGGRSYGRGSQRSRGR